MTTTTKLLWLAFCGLLLVLLPHAAWAFANWEPMDAGEVFGYKVPQFLHYVAAFVFESLIAVMVYKISKLTETTPKTKKVIRSVTTDAGAEKRIVSEPMNGFDKFVYRYVNAFGFLLLLSTVISILGNLAHAVQFGGELKIFTEWGIPKEIYSVAFGGILPIASLAFASVLSNVTESEEAANPEITLLNDQIKSVRSQLRESEQARKSAEEKAATAENRFGAAGDLMKKLFSDDKRERIIAIKEWRPELNGSAIAIIAESTPSHVSETLSKAHLN